MVVVYVLLEINNNGPLNETKAAIRTSMRLSSTCFCSGSCGFSLSVYILSGNNWSKPTVVFLSSVELLVGACLQQVELLCLKIGIGSLEMMPSEIQSVLFFCSPEDCGVMFCPEYVQIIPFFFF